MAKKQRFTLYYRNTRWYLYRNWAYRRPVPVVCLDDSWGYDWATGGYHRWLSTFQERKENAFVEYDEDCREHRVQVRGARRNHGVPDPWDDSPRSWHSPKSWKRLTRDRKQWMRNQPGSRSLVDQLPYHRRRSSEHERRYDRRETWSRRDTVGRFP